MSHPAKAKKSHLKSSVRFYETGHDKKRQKTLHRYTEYSAGLIGTTHVSKSTIELDKVTQDLPEGSLAADDHDSEWVDEPPDELPLDAAYLEHMAQTATDERVRRVRPKGVSS